VKTINCCLNLSDKQCNRIPQNNFLTNKKINKKTMMLTCLYLKVLYDELCHRCPWRKVVLLRQVNLCL